jgi:exopolysaccharide production protein ExoQ
MISVAYAALWLFVFSVPWERLIILSGISIISKATGALALGMTLLVVVISARLRRWRGIHVAAFLFVAWASIGVMVLHLQEVPAKLYTFIQLFLVTWMVWELATTARRLQGLLLAYVLGAYVAALETILLYRRAADDLRRFAAGGSDPNSLAMTLALALPMAWYLGMTHPKSSIRWVCRLYLPVGLLGIALTGSRGGLITAMVALLIVPLAMTNLSPGKLVSTIAMLGISGALAVAFVPDTLIQRFSTTSESVQDLSLGGRFRLWQAGIHAFFQRPVMGYGTAAYKQAITPEMGSLTQLAHNSYISVLVEEGIVGLMLFLLMFLLVVGPILRLPRLERRFTLVLLATLMVAMSPLTWEDQKPVWIILGVLIGMANIPALQQSEAVRRQFARRPAQRGVPAMGPAVGRMASSRPSPGRNPPQ